MVRPQIYGALILALLVTLISTGRGDAQGLPRAGHVELLDQAFDNLDLIWELELSRSDSYVEAHNPFVLASQQLPSALIFPLSMPEGYAEACVEYRRFSQQLTLLETCQRSVEREPEALLRESYERSQQLLTRYYLEQFDQKVQELNTALWQAVQKDPDSALADFVPKLEQIIHYTERLKTDPLLISPRHLIETQNTLLDAEVLVQLEQQIRQTLKNDVSFAPGKYKLADFSSQGKEAIQSFVQNLVAIKRQYPLQYPGQPLIMKIKTVGYTDEVPVTSPALIEELLQGVDLTVIPDFGLERQEFLNRRLSEFRARTVYAYTREQLDQQLGQAEAVQVESEIVGKGEQLPTETAVSPPYLERDPRRRICKISVIFRREPLPFLHNTLD